MSAEEEIKSVSFSHIAEEMFARILDFLWGCVAI